MSAKEIIIVNLSTFGYGTGSLHRVNSKNRYELLKHALDCGITHFDTAPYYGYGVCERALANFSNEDISITTKFGIEVTGGNDQSFFEMLSRKTIGKVFHRFNVIKYDYSVENANKSLEASLRRLNRENIDFFMIHEPQVHLIERDELLRWMEDKVIEGKISSFGVAGDKTKINESIDQLEGLVGNIQTNTALDNLGIREKFNYYFRYHWIRNHSNKNITEKIKQMHHEHSFKRNCYLFSSLKKSTINKYRK